MSEPISSAMPTAGAGLLGGVLGRGDVASCLDDRAWVRALLDVEAALARAQAAVGVLAPADAEAVTAACEPAEAFDADVLGREAAESGNPVVPLVKRLRERAGAAASAVHRGATSQDILDTALMLLTRDALVPLRADVRAAAEAAAALARAHRGTVIAGRTLMQQALPTTFGLKAAGWAAGLDATEDRLETRTHALPVQLGGAAGTRAGLGDGRLLVAALADELGLVAADLPWHTVRVPVTDLAGALGTAAGVLGKVALDVVLLAQSEVAEVREGVPGRGGSSAMAHKRNPVAAVSARAAALRAPGLVATLLTAAQVQEHERAAGGWHAEWLALTDLLRSVGSAAAWLRDCLEHLEVDAARMADTAAAAAAARGADGAPDVGEAAELVDRFLAARTRRAP